VDLTLESGFFMVKDIRVQQFITAVEQDFGTKLSFEDAAKILQGTVNYLLILEKIYLRIKNKEDNPENNIKKL
jgi:hypothetical protein